MKSTAFSFALLSVASALSVPVQRQADSAGLAIRADENQNVANPDNEPPWIPDPSTGVQEAKPGILTGLGPQAATDRFFDWDESCTDASQRAQIVATWDSFQTLTTVTSTRLGELQGNLPDRGKFTDVNKRYIWQVDPAYSQMFKASDDHLSYVKESFDLITRTVRDPQGRGGNRPGALRFVCNKDNKIKDSLGQPACGTGAGAAHALTIVPGGTIEARYSFSTSTSIVFCPAFFDDTQFPLLDTLATSNEVASFSLDNVNCKERILLHEYLHVPWVRNMNPTRFKKFKDYIGYYDCADVALLNWTYAKEVPDSYAWYAVYSYFNNLKGCGNDLWPKNVKKPVPAPK